MCFLLSSHPTNASGIIVLLKTTKNTMTSVNIANWQFLIYLARFSLFKSASLVGHIWFVECVVL